MRQASRCLDYGCKEFQSCCLEMTLLPVSAAARYCSALLYNIIGITCETVPFKALNALYNCIDVLAAEIGAQWRRGHSEISQITWSEIIASKKGLFAEKLALSLQRSTFSSVSGCAFCSEAGFSVSWVLPVIGLCCIRSKPLARGASLSIISGACWASSCIVSPWAPLSNASLSADLVWGSCATSMIFWGSLALSFIIDAGASWSRSWPSVALGSASTVNVRLLPVFPKNNFETKYKARGLTNFAGQDCAKDNHMGINDTELSFSTVIRPRNQSAIQPKIMPKGLGVMSWLHHNCSEWAVV